MRLHNEHVKSKFFLSAKKNIAEKVIFFNVRNPPFPKKKFKSSGLAYNFKKWLTLKIHRLLCNNF